MLLLLLTWTGCAGRKQYVVIPADREIKRVEASKPFTAAVNGWFVPDARWIEICRAIAEKVTAEEKSGGK